MMNNIRLALRNENTQTVFKSHLNTYVPAKNSQMSSPVF